MFVMGKKKEREEGAESEKQNIYYISRRNGFVPSLRCEKNGCQKNIMPSLSLLFLLVSWREERGQEEEEEEPL